MRAPDDGPTSLFDRFVGALIAMIFTWLTMIGLPMLIAMKGSFLLWGIPLAAYMSVTFHLWALAVSLVAFAVGFRAGTAGTLDLLSHLWGTPNTPNHGLGLNLWLAIIGVGICTLAVLWAANAL